MNREVSNTYCIMIANSWSINQAVRNYLLYGFAGGRILSQYFIGKW